MNTENDKYTELINQIKATQAKISNPQEFALKIMHSIELLSKEKKHNNILSIISLTSSIAASFFIGLFVFEQFLPPNNTEEYKNSNITSAYTLPTYDKNFSIEKATTFTEFSTLMQTKKERQEKQQAFYSNLINKYKTL